MVSLFSGVGGLEVGLERAGMRSVYQCEIEAVCRDVLERHWPGLPRWDDVRTLTGREILSRVDAADVVAWGSPCQDLSVAGHRAGLGGDRSSLFFEGMRIIREMREVSDGRYPAVTIWENVAGALTSHKGADFGRVLDEMAEAGALVVEWRLLDAQFFGVPQRRRRVFVVAVFDSDCAERCADPILSVRQGLHRDTAASGSQGEAVAGATAVGTGAANREGSGGVISFPTNFGSYAQATEEVAQSMAIKAGPPSVCAPSEPIVLDRAAYNQGDNALWDFVVSEKPPTPSLVARGPLAVGQDASALLTMRAGKPGGGKGPLVSENKSLSLAATNQQTLFQNAATAMVVRRLTPLECERLMGWADDWTRWRADGREVPDTTRYKMCGNGVASPCTEWIGGLLMPLLGGGS